MLARVLDRDPLATACAALLLWAALTPSLLPRSWQVQGVVCGVALAAGYGFGLLVRALLRRARLPLTRLDGARTRRRVTIVAITALPVGMLATLPAHQHDFEALGYTTVERFLYSGVLAVAAVVAAAIVLAALVVRACVRWIERQVGRRAPRIVGTAVALGCCVLAVSAAIDRALHHHLIAGANDAMQWRDTHIGDDDEFPDAPTLAERSGGPSSEVEWERTGYEGRRFLSRGPTAGDITEITGRDAIEPVRVYVGRAEESDLDAAAELAVRELDRLGGFEREVLHLVTPTGTGWMNEQFLQPVEFYFDGDVATVGVQYSHLPSGFALLDDRWAAVESSKALRAAIDEHLDGMPASGRPRIYVSGESLGSFGGGGVFDDLDDMVERADAGMWIGAPAFNELRLEAERRRDDGSLQIHPRIAGLPELAFGQDPEQFERDGVRFAFLQNADDPFMWWDARLAVRRPDWLREPLDERVNPKLRWIPLVTWMQVGLDQAVGNSFEEGQGHLYGTLPTDAWHSIIDPQGWTDDQVDQLRDRMRSVER